MCGSMVDIQPATAEIRCGIKKKKKIEITGQKYNGSLLHRAAITIDGMHSGQHMPLPCLLEDETYRFGHR